jgi:hypothetical protein
VSEANWREKNEMVPRRGFTFCLNVLKTKAIEVLGITNTNIKTNNSSVFNKNPKPRRTGKFERMRTIIFHRFSASAVHQHGTLEPQIPVFKEIEWPNPARFSDNNLASPCPAITKFYIAFDNDRL